MLSLTVLSGLFEAVSIQKGTRVIVNLGTAKEPYLFVGTAVARSLQKKQYHIKFDDGDTYTGSITNSATGILGLAKTQRKRKIEIDASDIDSWIDTNTWFATTLADSDKPGPTLKQFMRVNPIHEVETDEVPDEVTLTTIYAEIVKRYQSASTEERLSLLQNLGKIGSDLVTLYNYTRQDLEAIRNSVPSKEKPTTKEVPRTKYAKGNINVSVLSEEQAELFSMLERSNLPVVRLWEATPDTDFAFDLGHLTIEQSGEDGTWQIVERVGNNHKFWPETRSLKKLVKGAEAIINSPQIVRAALFINSAERSSKRSIVLANVMDVNTIYSGLSSTPGTAIVLTLDL